MAFALLGLGIALVITGAALIYLPTAFLVAGFVLIGLALFGDFGVKADR